LNGCALFIINLVKKERIMVEIVGFTPLREETARMYGALALAYAGDGIYELLVRSYLLSQGNAPVNSLHSRAKEFVRADARAVSPTFWRRS
jgi:23S rRNA maturation mini-RNase III